MTSLLHKPDAQVKQDLLQALFQGAFVTKNSRHFKPYFDYYEREIGKLSVGRLSQNRPSLIISSHKELVTLIAKFEIRATDSRSDVCAMLQTRFDTANEQSISQSLDLIIRLWLMLNTREAAVRLHASQTPLVAWSPDWPFSLFIDHAFSKSRWSIDNREGRLHPSFTAIFMVNICGLELEWTNCLADHLRLDRRRKVLKVFSCKAFVAGHLDTYIGTENKRRSPLPRQLLTETLWTLNLLFPHWDPPTNALLRKHGQSFQDTGPYEGPPTLNLVEFKYWRDRIADVYDVVFSSPPVSWAQLWKDRRNPQQFWTFWIALVILLLTIVSTAATIVQTCAAVASPHNW